MWAMEAAARSWTPEPPVQKLTTPSVVEFCGVPFTPEALEAATARIATQAALRAPFVYVVTPNVDHVVKLHREPRQRGPLYAGAWLRLNDSRILERLGALSSLDLPVSTGADITALLFEHVIRPEDPVVVIGGAAAAVDAIRFRYKLKDIRWHEPPMGLAKSPAAIEAAAEFAAAQRAAFTFICVGAPQQEMVAQAIAARSDSIGVGLCVGASLDFLSGRQKRAPEALQRLGLEWAFRLAQEPSRLWRRYLIDGPAIFTIWLKWRGGHRARPVPLDVAPHSAGSSVGTMPSQD
jgi:exopolysaccharide biosynthesis WecB/TagA/CpsF family protein